METHFHETRVHETVRHFTANHCAEDEGTAYLLQQFWVIRIGVLLSPPGTVTSFRKQCGDCRCAPAESV
jgi:hypothetical protein